MLAARAKEIELFLLKAVGNHGVAQLFSHLSSQSMDFKGHRPYEFGDDASKLDRTLYYRTRQHYIKEYDFEDTLEFVLALDLHPSVVLLNKLGKSHLESFLELSSLLLMAARKKKATIRLLLMSSTLKEVELKGEMVHPMFLLREIRELGFMNKEGEIRLPLYEKKESYSRRDELKKLYLRMSEKKRGVVFFTSMASSEDEEMFASLSKIVLRLRAFHLPHEKKSGFFSFTDEGIYEGRLQRCYPLWSHEEKKYESSLLHDLGLKSQRQYLDDFIKIFNYLGPL